jgi:protein TonB
MSSKLYSAKIEIKNAIEVLSDTKSYSQSFFNNTRIEPAKKEIKEEQIMPEPFVPPEFVSDTPKREFVPDTFSVTNSRRISPEEFKRWSSIRPNNSVSGSVFIPAQPTGESIQNKLPPYPEKAQQLGQEGLVILTIEILKDGTAGKIEIITSSGYPLLDESALKTVLNWKFVPAKVNGRAVTSTITIPIRFRLE